MPFVAQDKVDQSLIYVHMLLYNMLNLSYNCTIIYRSDVIYIDQILYMVN